MANNKGRSRTEKKLFPGLRIVTRKTTSGRVLDYTYHRATGRRIFSPAGSLGFRAEYEAAELEAPRPRGVDFDGRKAPRATRTYFVQGSLTGLVKIGKAFHPATRLMELQTGSPDLLTLLGTIEDQSGGLLESQLHRRFSALREHGEWFRPGEALMAYVAEHARPPTRKALLAAAASAGQPPPTQLLAGVDIP